MGQQLTQERIGELFAAIDARDAIAFAAFLTEDVRFIFGNAPAVVGRNDTREMVAGFLLSVAGLEHDLEQTWVQGDALICTGRVTYTRHDGGVLTVPFCNVLRLREGRIAHYQIYGDMSALYA